MITQKNPDSANPVLNSSDLLAIALHGIYHAEVARQISILFMPSQDLDPATAQAIIAKNAWEAVAKAV
jgi:hypothetical protein